ncbi:ABC transporter permease [Dinghuibacter silviterrae]|uniref:Transport permease protein n=1 Tax=Dinghuibacter silviterrae TaxID=1539049 RepID=A0A4R8DU14_9BACT|nr:ABC transporter permease [Dinghuibacter silviterrae]TDX01629.1 ABC-2 type transport system permease protein [Dinghuibacter silviterrae]
MFKLFYIRKLREVIKNPVMLSFSLFMPLMYLLLYAPLLKNLTGMPGFQGGSVLNTFLPGVLISLTVFGGAFSGFRLIDEIRQGIIERFRVTPTSRLALLMGAVARDVTNVVVQGLIFTAAAIPFGLHVDPLGFVLLLLLMMCSTALFASYSYAIALMVKNEDALVPFAQMVAFPLLMLAGFLLPMELAPHWLRAAAYADPLYYSVAAARQLMNGHLGKPVIWEAFAITVPLAAGVIVWAGASFKRVIQ